MGQGESQTGYIVVMQLSCVNDEGNPTAETSKEGNP